MQHEFDKFYEKSRLIGQSLTLALLLALGSVVAVQAAGKGKGKGPRAGIDVANYCSLGGSLFSVETVITDASDNEVVPPIFGPDSSVTLLGLKRGGPKNVVVLDTVFFQAQEGSQITGFDLCAYDLGAVVGVNSAVIIDLQNRTGGKRNGLSCDDDPLTDVDESDIDIAGLDLGC